MAIAAPHTPSPAPQWRIKGIDICRAFAIIAAMWSHAMAEFDIRRYWEFGETSYILLRFAMQIATPAFLCLFGAMLEIVYARRFVAGEGLAATAQLLNRAVQCYLLYTVSVAAMAVGGGISIGYALRCILLMGVTPFTDMLKFYAIALALAPALIAVRMRIGLSGTVGLVLAVHLAYPLLKMVPDPGAIMGKDYLGPVVGFLYGGGDGTVGGPSVLHGLTFVSLGMILGHAVNRMFSPCPRMRTEGIAWMAGLFLVSTLAVLLLWNWDDPHSTVVNFLNMHIRNDNQPLYFALGIATTTALLSLCLYLFDIRAHRWGNRIRFMGQTTLFTFCFGNAILYLQPFQVHDRLTSYGLTAGFAVLVIAQSWVFARLNARSVPIGNTLWGWAKWAMQETIALCRTGIARFVRPIVRPYARMLGFRLVAMQA